MLDDRPAIGKITCTTNMVLMILLSIGGHDGSLLIRYVVIVLYPSRV